MANLQPTHADFGAFVSPNTLVLKRLLPGPIERVWRYLVDSELRRQWLAAGAMDLKAGANFELVWRNDELSNDANERPEGFPQESRATCRVIDARAPNVLRFDWPDVGEVSFELQTQGDQVLLTLTHRRLIDQKLSIMVAAGWHMHCDILVARVAGETAPSFWPGWLSLRDLYQQRWVSQ